MQEPPCADDSRHIFKWMEAIPVPDMLAVTIAEVIVQEVGCRFGTPQSLDLDQGCMFKSQVVRELVV